MANIAEGFSRKGNREFTQLLFVAKSSAAELQSHLYVALDQGYITQQQFDGLYSEIDRIQRQLSTFIEYLNSVSGPPRTRKLNEPDKLDKRDELNEPDKLDGPNKRNEPDKRT